jgi:hypothetical protein
MRNMEAYASALLSCGFLVAVLSWVWLLARAFQQRAWWGAISLILPPMALVFALRHAQKAIGPLVLFALGAILAAVPVVYSLAGPVDLGLREQLHREPAFVTVARNALESDAAHEWMDIRAFYLQSGGLAVAALAWLWLLVRAFRQHRRWGLCSLIVPPVGFVFAGRHPRRGGVPLGLVFLCLLVAAIPALYNHYVPLNLGAREKNVDGEKHLTLTGSDSKNAPDLKSKQDVTVLQMANDADVTDEKLESIREMKSLRELDLSGSGITDRGLEILKELPALDSLHIARTKVTDKGFRSALFDKESLMRLDVRETGVSRETIQLWRSAKPGRHAMP